MHMKRFFSQAMTVGGCYQPWLIRWLQNWKPFHHVLYLQTVVVVAIPLYVHESVRWLVSRGRAEECQAILDAIAMKNGKPALDEEFRERFSALASRQRRADSQNATSWTALFTTPGLRKNFLVMLVTWMLIAGMFDGHVSAILANTSLQAHYHAFL